MNRQQKFELLKLQKEKIAGFLFDLAKMVFGSIVLGIFTTLLSNKWEDLSFKIYIGLCAGCLSIGVLFLFAHKTLKQDNL